jgi:hypothetical protein
MKMTADKREISKINKRRDRYEIPDWQRQKVWTRSRKQLLIDSILRGWKLPKFYFLKISDDPEEFEVVDGQQRLSTIFEFFADELPLTEESMKEFGGPYYHDLKPKYSDGFDDFEIEFDVIEEANEAELKQFFQRLQLGLPLTASEQLNSEHSNLRDYCRQLAKHKFFTDKVSIRDYRYAHFDVAAKVAAIEIDGLEVGLRYDDLKKVFASQASFSDKTKVAQRLQQTFDYLNKMFPEKTPLLRNRTVTQSLATLVARVVYSGKGSGYEKKLAEFFSNFMNELAVQVELGPNATDQDYILFQKSVTANVRSAARARYEVLLRKMLAFDPIFFDIIGSGAMSESGMSNRVKALGESIVTLVNRLNAEYAAIHGTDLIKPTNKTARALTRIGKMIKNYESYETFIDDLYFTFHEGVGGRFNEKKPASFAEINDLRTNLRHDLDHGSESKSATKIKKVGATFQKYAGTNTPETLSPERFPVVQLGLLNALESDLQQLLLKVDKI